MIKLVDVDTLKQVIELNLPAGAAPRQGEYIKTPAGEYLVTSRTYDVTQIGNLNHIELMVKNLEN
jgi:hypothetical protein